jgi:uncharacterized protein YcgI (DUF1989 family)
MRTILERRLAYNTGGTVEVRAGQCLRVRGRTTADTVAFNLINLRERFDQARTKVLTGKIFLGQGDVLFSKFNAPMLTITASTWREGKHDLQKGMCSASTYGRFKGPLYEVYDIKGTFGVEREALPDHGCWENLTEALKPWNVPPEDIPSPFNIFQDMKIDGETGRMEMTNKQPARPEHVDLRAEMDCLVAVSACPWFGKGEPLDLIVFDP